jgi:membrane protein DedA with SNARE-associated domain/membrane-associated phospholipid phosphatase
MPPWLAQLLDHYGYAMVALGVFLENSGLPIPGETVLLAAAFLAQRGMLQLPLVMAIATAAAILGDNLGYFIGYRGGRALVERHGPKVGLTAARLAALDGFFARHGAKTVFFARFVTGLRVFCALFAGITRLPWQRFLFFNATGAVVWAVACGTLGYLFGHSWHLLERWVGRAGLFVAGLVVAALLGWGARRHGRRLVALARRHVITAFTLRELLLGIGHLAAVAVFIKIADTVTSGEASELDRQVILAVHAQASPFLDDLMLTFTTIGSAVVIVPLALVVLIACLRRGERRAAVVLATIATATQAINLLLKHHFHRARPSLWVGPIHVESYSFPSGHAMSAVAIYGLLAIIAGRLAPRWRALPYTLAPLLVAAIGVSRVYLGVHWPTDILAGFTAGAFVLLLAMVAMGPARDEG